MNAALSDSITDRWVASVARRGPKTATTRQRMGASHLGMPFGEYAAQTEAGNKWCSGHRRFESRVLFGTHRRRVDGLNTMCREWNRQVALAYGRRLRAERRAS